MFVQFTPLSLLKTKKKIAEFPAEALLKAYGE